MTNDEKIKELICKHCQNHTKTEECTLDTGCRQYSNLLKMAKWKDAQIVERSAYLEEEIENYIKDSLAIKFPATDKEQIKSDIRYIARHFANWQKQQMKNAFIERAARYLNLRLYDRVEVVTFGTIIESIISKEEFIDDFKNYMKGE